MPTHFPHNAERGESRNPLQHRLIRIVAIFSGSVLVLVGLVGALPAGMVATGCDMSVTGGLASMVLGGVGCLFSGSRAGARGFLVGGGLVYLMLSVIGVFGVHTAVHACAAAAMILSGALLGRPPDWTG